jgi:hypothetical protein
MQLARPGRRRSGRRESIGASLKQTSEPVHPLAHAKYLMASFWIARLPLKICWLVLTRMYPIGFIPTSGRRDT